MDSATLLAKAFYDALAADLDSATMRDIRRRNALPEYRDSMSCASHDFCDANLYMLEAFEHVFKREANLDEDSADMALINAAWEIAHMDYLTNWKMFQG